MRGLSRILGLNQLKQRINIGVESARRRKALFPHSLIYGLGGCGKTEISRAIAEELHYHFKEIEAASLRTRPQIVDLLLGNIEEAERYNKNLLLLVDECHRLPTVLQEVFYIPMTEFRIVDASGEDIKFTPFTLFAATTRVDMLDVNSFYSRFGNHWHIDRYPAYEMNDIVDKMLHDHHLQYSPGAALSLSAKSLGIPRRALMLVGKVRDYALAYDCTYIEEEIVDKMCGFEGIDSIGLDEIHNKYLRKLSVSNKPKGLKGLAASLEEPEDVVSGMIEPILLSLGFIALSSGGRMITDAGMQHISEICVDKG